MYIYINMSAYVIIVKSSAFLMLDLIHALVTNSLKWIR